MARPLELGRRLRGGGALKRLLVLCASAAKIVGELGRLGQGLRPSMTPVILLS